MFTGLLMITSFSTVELTIAITSAFTALGTVSINKKTSFTRTPWPLLWKSILVTIEKLEDEYEKSMKSGAVPNTTSRTRWTIHPLRNGPSGGPFLQGHYNFSMHSALYSAVQLRINCTAFSQ